MQQINAVRKQITGIQAEIAKVLSAPLNEKDSLAQLDASLNAIKGDFDHEHLALISANGRSFNASDFMNITAPGRPLEEKVLAWFMTINGDKMREILAAGMKPYCDPKAMPKDQRADAVLALQQKLREAEIEEERLISAKENIGQYIPRRADFDPSVMLEIAEDFDHE